MRPCHYCALLPALLIPACGDDESAEPVTPTATVTTATGSGGATTGSGGAGGRGGCAAFDLADGSWELQNASNTADTNSHDGSIAVTSGGVIWIAFAEPLPEPDDSDQDIFTTARAASTFEAATPLTQDSGTQHDFPSLVAADDELHLVWHGPPAGDNDIFYARYDGSWSTPLDLTSPSEGTTARSDYRPEIALGPGGNGYVAYLSDDPSGPASVRVIRINAGAPSGDPITVIDGSTDGCYAVAAAVDADGDAHVVAECGPMSSESIHYATNRTGDWASALLADGSGGQHTSPDIAVGPDGSSVHVVWQAWQSCNDGSCADIHYARSAGGAFATAVPVTETVDDTEASPRVAVDPQGRPLVVYARSNGDGYFDVFATVSEDGASFGAEVNVTPDSDDSDQWMPYGLTFHPLTCLPHLTFTEVVPSSDPHDTEVVHAEFVPGS